MQAKKEREKKITSREENFSQWYLDVISAAELAENAPVRGCMIIRPNGYALWEAVKEGLDKRFKATGVKNAYFPLFIPESFLKKEEEHVEGFAPEAAVVTHAGGKKLEEPLVVRPTSETIIYDTFSRWIQSYRDLPLLVNQWSNVVRWELRPRVFLRTTEFLWQEGHTVHETQEEADDKAREMLEIYRDFAESMMAIPVIPGKKSEAEKFAGAFCTYTIEAMMQDGKALQFGTSHNLGQNFAKPFDVSFLGRSGEKEYGWQTCWGLSTRSIGGLVMTHGDDKGIIVPPKIAATQVVITTVGHGEKTKEVIKKATEIENILLEEGIKAEKDVRDVRPGEKFYKYEKTGVPLRIEVGPKDIDNNKYPFVRRDNGEKLLVPAKEIVKSTKKLLEDIQSNLYNRALDYRSKKTKSVDNWEDFVKAIEDGNFVYAHWSGEKEVEKQIQKETAATIRCIPFDQKKEEGRCVKTGKPSTGRVIFARAY
jgi:prolyl-tRNA synthetase